MLEIAKKVVPEAAFIHGDMIDIEFADEFAAAVAWDSVFHVARKHHSTVFRRLAGSLRTGGRLLLSVGGSDADSRSCADSRTEDSTADDVAEMEGFTSEMYGHTFFYSGYSPEVTRRLLEAAGFEIEVWEVDDPSSRGHIAIIARKITLPG